MTSFGKMAYTGIRALVAGPLCAAILVLGCGSAGSDPDGANASTNANRSSTESNQGCEEPPSGADAGSGVPRPRVVGYLPTYRMADKPALHLETLTHLNLAFAAANEQGKVDFVEGDSVAISAIVKQAHESKVKVLVAVSGGAGGTATSERLAKTGGVDAFVNSLIDLVEDYDLDGVDIDIEGDGIDSETYGPLLQTLSMRLAKYPERKLLTAAVAEYRKERYRALGSVDFLNIMSYDHCGYTSEVCEHSTLSQAQVDLDYWSNVRDVDANGTLRTIGKDNVVLGVPFYGRCWGEQCPRRAPNDDGSFDHTVPLAYAQIQAYCEDSKLSGCSASADVLQAGDATSGYYLSLNSPNTIRAKAVKAKAYGGIMIWELGQDDSKSSLFAEIAPVFAH
jgi:chitinase